jgi:heptosyltransferase-2
MGETPRILVKATNWLGDVVMSLPALRALRDAFPGSHLAVLVRRDLASLLDGSTWIDEVIAYDRSRLGRLGALARVTGLIRARRFDVAVIFPSSFESALWPFLAGVPRRIGYARDWRAPLLTTSVEPSPAVARAHQVHWYLDLVRQTLGAEGSENVALDVDAAARGRRSWLASRRRRPQSRLIALAPAAAYGPAKEWPAPSYAALIDRLAERSDAECVLVGAPSERERCEAVAAASTAGALVAAGETSAGDLAALVSHCDGFAGNDSGCMHVAGALGKPTVGIYGSTSPERTGPRGPRTRVLYRRLACSPCLARTCRFGHYDCLRQIGPDDVTQALGLLGALG